MVCHLSLMVSVAFKPFMLIVIMLSVIILSAIKLIVIMLTVIMLTVIMLTVIMLTVIMLSAVILSVIMLSVLAPHGYIQSFNLFLSSTDIKYRLTDKVVLATLPATVTLLALTILAMATLGYMALVRLALCVSHHPRKQRLVQ
jgi:hypothetical protein